MAVNITRYKKAKVDKRIHVIMCGNFIYLKNKEVLNGIMAIERRSCPVGTGMVFLVVLDIMVITVTSYKIKESYK